MPELPAKNKAGDNSPEGTPERLATAQELAEFGSIPPDPELEVQILTLLEAQMREDSPAEESAVARPGVLTKAVTQAPAKTPVVNPAETSMETTVERVKTPRTKTEKAAEIIVPARAEAETKIEPNAGRAAESEPLQERQPSGADLLELAEALDQHRLWVENAGKEGVRGEFTGADLTGADLTAVNLQGALLHKVNLRGADLSMANLRGTELVEADLREANLLGAEFSGANLMGANLYGAQGLWAGRLGGTNLFDATLPEAVSAHDGGKTIGQFTQSARWFYLLLMVLCLGACGLVALTTDVRLLLDASAAPTARIPNILPLKGFYLGAPLLLTAFYLRLQFLLLRLWGSMGALPAVFPDGQTPEKDGPWYLMGPIRPHLKWSRDPRSPLSLVEGIVAKLVAYWGVPAVLFLFWLRYLVLQDYRGTLLQVFLFTLASMAACGLPRIVARVLRPGDWSEESTSAFVHDVLATLRKPIAAGLVMFLLSLGVIRGLPPDTSIKPEISRGDPRRWAATAFQSVGFRPYADISEENISGQTAKAATSDTASADGSGPRLNEINLRYARGYRSAFASARMWRANLEGASLSEADFRGANLREANLKGARLDRMQAEKANMVSADAQGAVLSGAGFQNSDLSYANLEGATLTTADLTRATLYAVNLRHANLLRAQLAHADLRDVKLEGGVLSLAQMEQTDLSAAKLVGADLTGVVAKGTIFLEADMSRTDLRGGMFPGAILRQARLDGANVEGADLRGALGLEAWQVCSTRGWRGAQLDPDVRQATEQNCGGQ
jgi:uncharacterized protein YjbI with pentapeptide repeats